MRHMRIRTFTLGASALVAAAFFGGGYLIMESILGHAVRENARTSAQVMARATFNSMYQLMSTGWTRAQAEAYLAALHDATAESGMTLHIWRGPAAAVDFGTIRQPEPDAALAQVLVDAQPLTLAPAGSVRHLMPLVAAAPCLECHLSAKPGQVLGVIEVKQDFTPVLVRARKDFLFWLGLAAPLILAVAGFLVWRVNRRLEQALGILADAVTGVEAVSDLRKVEFTRHDLGFTEFNQLFGHLGHLVDKLRTVAVDKEVLRFEIGLMEKFVITSEVVRDWGEYIARLLAEINTVMPTHVLFSVFRVGDEVFDLEIFWSAPPSAQTRQMMEHHVRAVVAADARLSALAQVSLHHHAPPGGKELVLDQRSVVLETKALILEQPRIGGIVGIGVHASCTDDDVLRLVMDSILSTMLNVVGSVKAIHKYTQDMEYYATRDPLTDLYNRRVFWELFEYEVARARRAGYSFALLVIDLDNFKLINDGHGHAVGDRYLQAFTRAVRQVLRPGDIFARYGGDEFVVLLPDVMPDMATVIGQRVLTAVADMRLDADGTSLSGSASIGLALYPLHADNAKDLFLFADTMLYKAKDGGKNQLGLPSDAEIAEVFRDMAETTVQVVDAVNQGAIEPYFQPIMDLKTERIIGHEVLSRLSLEGRQIEASRFIEHAERAGVIHRLDTLVMEKALREAAIVGYEGLLFLNLSPRALALADFLRDIKRLVAVHQIQPERIVFEITERDTLKNLATLEALVADLKLAGFKLAIDDFGSGFSSFQYLRRLPVDFVKIEGDFIVNLQDSERDRTFVETIQHLAAGLGIQVVAEHVESAEVLSLLQGMGVDMGQGYHIGRPAQALAPATAYPARQTENGQPP
jgi:diguanylate cyclase (GGDEF)-like protein